MIGLSTSGLSGSADHYFTKVSVDLGSASGSSELRIDLTGSSPYAPDGTGSSTQQRLDGPGGVPLGLLNSPPGDGVSSTNSNGSGGGFVGVGDNKATTNATQNVSASVDADLVTAGGDVTIKSNSQTSTSANSKNATGGFVGVGTARADTTTTSNSSASVGSGGHSGWIIAGGNFTLEADNAPVTGSSSKSTAGGFVGVATNHTTANVNFGTNATINDNSSVLALQLARVGSYTSVNAASNSEANGGGFGADANAHSSTNVGGTNQSTIGNNASLIADRVIVEATVPKKASDEDTNPDAHKGQGMSVTSNADGRGAGFVSVGTAEAFVGINATAEVSIGTGATVTGWEGVDLIARFAHINDNVGDTAHSYARSSGLFGHVSSDANNSTTLNTSVYGAPHATITAGPRDPSDPDLTHVAGYDQLALFVDTRNGPVNTHRHGDSSKRSLATGGDNGDDSPAVGGGQDIDFSSDVNILGAVFRLVVDASGTITAGRTGSASTRARPAAARTRRPASSPAPRSSSTTSATQSARRCCSRPPATRATASTGSAAAAARGTSATRSRRS